MRTHVRRTARCAAGDVPTLAALVVDGTVTGSENPSRMAAAVSRLIYSISYACSLKLGSRLNSWLYVEHRLYVESKLTVPRFDP
jgi:hypothetical protein